MAGPQRTHPTLGPAGMPATGSLRRDTQPAGDLSLGGAAAEQPSCVAAALLQLLQIGRATSP
jgi:hypothetical protein